MQKVVIHTFLQNNCNIVGWIPSFKICACNIQIFKNTDITWLISRSSRQECSNSLWITFQLSDKSENYNQCQMLYNVCRGYVNTKFNVFVANVNIEKSGYIVVWQQSLHSDRCLGKCSSHLYTQWQMFNLVSAWVVSLVEG